MFRAGSEGTGETARCRDGLHGDDLHVTLLRLHIPVAHCRPSQWRGSDRQRVSRRASVTQSSRGSPDNQPLLRTSQTRTQKGRVLQAGGQEHEGR